MEEFTTRELLILEYMAKGHSNTRIAMELFMSKHTIKFIVANILKKLNAANRTNAIYIAAKKNIL